ncbi:MAG TPA: hypothetical protein VKQ36_00890, partial [Ktedonobacterales bacterium]|nr:hypothetical protein [Ktedonobacterales bacterium]
QPTSTPVLPAQLAFDPMTLTMAPGPRGACAGTITVTNNGPGVSNWSWSQITPFTPWNLRCRIDINGKNGAWVNGLPQGTQQPGAQEKVDIHFNCFGTQTYAVTVISNSSGGQATYTLTLQVSSNTSN